MKIKPHILTATIAIFTSAAFAAEPSKTTNSTQSSVTVKSSSGTATAGGSGISGKATVTIDVNGKKETREIDLGNGTEIKANQIPLENGSMVFGGGGGNVTVNTQSGTGITATIGATKTVTWLGISPEEVSEELRAQLPLEPGSGLVVRSVSPGSPAEKIGLQKNDVLMKLDDQLLTNPSQLRTLVGAKKEGDVSKLTYFRKGQQLTAEVKFATHVESDTGDLLSAIPQLSRLFQLQSKAVVLDKDGQVVGGAADNMKDTVEKLTASLRSMGVDESSIAEAKRALTQTTEVIRDALKDASVAKTEVQKGSADIAKALDEVREAVEKVRKDAEEAVKREREKRQESKQP